MRSLHRLAFGLVLGFGFGFGLPACSLNQSFFECNQDSECPTTSDNKKLFCSSEHLCVIGTPKERLCQEIYPAGSPSDAIVVGVLVNTTTGNDLLPLLSYKMGIDQINARRTAPGERKIALHICETGSVGASDDDPLKSTKILARERGAVAVLGPNSSRNVFNIAAEIQSSQMPMMSPSATAPDISGLEGNGLFFRVAPSDALQGPILSNQIPTTVTKLGLLYVDDAYGNGLKNAFVNELTKAGRKVPDLTLSYGEKTGTPDFLAMQSADLMAKATQLNNLRPDAVVAITNTFSAEVITALLPLPMSAPATKIYMADGAKNNKSLALIGAAPQPTMNQHLMRITGSAPTVDDLNRTGSGAYPAFKTDFQAVWKMDPSTSIYSAYAYDAVYALGIAIGAAGTEVTRARVSEMLLRFSGMRDKVTVGQSNYLVAKSQLAQAPGLTLQGASGSIRFTGHGDRESGLYEVWGFDVTNRKFTSTPAM